MRPRPPLSSTLPLKVAAPNGERGGPGWPIIPTMLWSDPA
jgi:hypothetical protein